MGGKPRLLVLCNLVEGERSVGELQRIVGLSQSALSQHLAVLRRTKLVETRREMQTIYYRLAGGAAVSGARDSAWHLLRALGSAASRGR